MAIVFNADEVLGMAVEIERNGAKFYRKAADSNSELRDLLLQIAGQEDEHEETFSALRSQLQGRETESTAFDPDGEAQLYLKAMADSHVFNVKEDAATALTGDETAEQIIDLAIGKEKDSIVFYTGLEKMVPESLGKDRMDLIIKEEFRHIVWLNERRS